MAIKLYIKTALIGGTVNSLDGINGTLLNANDVGLVFTNNVMYPYLLNALSTRTESSPSIITPDSNAGTKRWLLQTPTTVTYSI